MEEWKDIKGYEGKYQVSNYGRVRSLDRVVSTGLNRSRTSKGKVLKPVMVLKGDNKRPYNVISLSNGVVVNQYIHILVAESFVGRIDGLVVDHIDNNSLNNLHSNLQYITQKENATKDRKMSNSGVRGIYWVESRKEFMVRVNAKTLGYSKTMRGAQKIKDVNEE
jgi:hypothetical protein